MEPKRIELPSQSACSFEPVLHPEYDSIRAQCDPWLLALTEPPSPSATEFWVGSLFPLLGSFAHAHCPAKRVVHIVNFLSWIFTSDDKDDDPSILGSFSFDNPLICRRHFLILACCSPAAVTDIPLDHVIDSPCTIKEMRTLHGVCQTMLADMSPRLQARFLDTMRDYLNAVAIQCHYRSIHSLPDVDEFVVVRRVSSLMYVAFVLLEYGLSIEMDEETLASDLFQQLQDAGADHIGFTNDVLSYKVEIFSGDQINLPSVLYNVRALKQGAADAQCGDTDAGADADRKGGESYTFEDAMQEALRMLEEVDKQCVRVMQEMQTSSLIHKPGMEAYVRGVQLWIAGNKAWSLQTCRYTHKCPADGQGLIVAVQDINPCTASSRP